MSTVNVIFLVVDRGDSIWPERWEGGPISTSRWAINTSPTNSTSTFDVNTTYEEIVQMLIKRQFLLPLDDPDLHYKMQLGAYEISPDDWLLLEEGYWYLLLEWPSTNDLPPLGGIVWVRRRSLRAKYTARGSTLLEEGQTLASTRIINSKITCLACYISLEKRKTPLPSKEKPSSASPSLSETISAVAQTANNVLIVTASVATIIQTLIVVQERWEKTHHTPNKASSQQHISRRQIIPWLYSQMGGIRSASPPKSTPNSKGTDILSIRLRMSHGDDHEFEEWLTDPDRLKHYIDVFNQPSSSIQPLQAIFVQRNGKEYKVDVSKGAQNNLQLDELFSYLDIDEIDKDRE